MLTYFVPEINTQAGLCTTVSSQHNICIVKSSVVAFAQVKSWCFIIQLLLSTAKSAHTYIHMHTLPPSAFPPPLSTIRVLRE